MCGYTVASDLPCFAGGLAPAAIMARLSTRPAVSRIPILPTLFPLPPPVSRIPVPVPRVPVASIPRVPVAGVPCVSVARIARVSVALVSVAVPLRRAATVAAALLPRRAPLAAAAAALPITAALPLLRLRWGAAARSEAAGSQVLTGLQPRYELLPQLFPVGLPLGRAHTFLFQLIDELLHLHASQNCCRLVNASGLLKDNHEDQCE